VRVVVDPNVIVSAMLTPGSAPDRVLQAALGGTITVIVSPKLLEEVREVTARPKFEWLDREEVERVLDGLAACESAADPTEVPAVTRDPGDDYLIALARTAGAEMLVSGDLDLLEAEISDPAVLNPRGFVDEHLGGS
jgi:uncharacterized protein